MKPLRVNRWQIGLAAALMLAMLSACSAPKYASAPQELSDKQSVAGASMAEDAKADYGYRNEGAPPMAASEPMAPEAAYDIDRENAAIEKETPAGGASTAQQPAANQDAKRIYTGDVSLSTKEFDNDLARISGMLTDVDGYIQDQELRGNPPSETFSGDRTIRMTLRVPSDRFATVIGQLKSIGSEHSVNTYVNDITSEYYDSNARLDAYRIQLARLQELVSKAEKLSDIVALEQEISRVQYSIESISGQMRRWDNQVALSTISVVMWERTVSVYQAINPTLGERVVSGWVDSINGVREFLENFSVVLVMLVPVVVALAIPVVGIILIVRAVRKHRAKRAVG